MGLVRTPKHTQTPLQTLTNESHTTAGARRFGLFHLVCLTVFAALALATIAHHELWRDEIQHWSIAVASNSIPDIFENLQYENSPALWHLLLYGITRITHDPAAMQALHLVLAAAAAAVFLIWSPFSRLQRALFIFGYFSIYEYCAISRHYVLGSLLLFGFLALHPWTGRRAYGAAVLLFLVAQTSLFGLMIALGGAAAMIVRRLGDGGAAALRNRHLVGAMVIVAAGGLWSIIQILPEEDCILHPAWDFVNTTRLFQAGTTFWRTLVPLPQFQTIHFWNTNVLDTFPMLHRAEDMPSLLAQGVLALALLVASCLYLRKRADALVFFLIIAGLCGMLFYVKKLGYLRHHGHLYLAWIGALWIYWAHVRRSAQTSTSGTGQGRFFPALVTVILAVHVVAGLYACVMDIRYPFSPNKAAAEWVASNGHRNDLLVAPTAVGYFLDREVYVAPAWSLRRFDIWRTPWRMPDDEELVKVARERRDKSGKPVLIVWESKLDFPGADQQIRELTQFTDVINVHEQYHVYSLLAEQVMTAAHP